ncbi:MAG: hypothetical protein Kow00124_06560 [Anaerolineae bacterium]
MDWQAGRRNVPDYDQMPLFPDEPEGEDSGPPADLPLDYNTPLGVAIQAYEKALALEGLSPYTIRAFRSDLNLLASWAGPDRVIGSFGAADLNRFLHWMLNERGVPCSPKTYARRVTAIKHFFGYLASVDALLRDPSVALVQKSVKSPLPDVLYDSEIDRALRVTQRLRTAPASPDARPHMLLTLLLHTGIKKGEVMALTPADIIRKESQPPLLWIRYNNPRMRYKERKIELEPDWLVVYDEYMAQRKPSGPVFDCTARNLEYVLRDVATAAGLPPNRLSFETLRWTCALHDYLSGMDPDRLREKLGLSRISWRETASKLAALAEKMT